MARAPFNAKDGITTPKDIIISGAGQSVRGKYDNGANITLIGTMTGNHHVIGEHDPKMGDLYIRAKDKIIHNPSPGVEHEVYTKGNKPTALEINAVANTPEYSTTTQMFDDRLNQRQFEVFASGPNDSGLTGIRGGVHIPAGGSSSPNAVQLAFRTINNEYTIRQTDGTTTSDWNNLYHTGYKPSARAINALPSTTEHLRAAAGSSERWIEDFQSTNQQRLSFLDSKAGYFGFKMSLSNNTGASHTGIFEVSTKGPDGTATDPILKAFNKDIYWEGNKPSATDVNALPITGGMLTGQLDFGPSVHQTRIHRPDPASPSIVFDSVSNLTLHADRDGSNPAESIQVKSGENTLKITSSRTDTGNKSITYNGNEVYHKGNRPSLTDINAYSKDGGTLEGNIQFSPVRRGIEWANTTHATAFTEGASIIMDHSYDGAGNKDYLVFTKTDQNGLGAPDGGFVFDWKSRNSNAIVETGQYMRLDSTGVTVTPRFYAKSESAFGATTVDSKVLVNLKSPDHANRNWVIQAVNSGTVDEARGIKSTTRENAIAFGAFTPAAMKAYIKGGGKSYFASSMGIGVAPNDAYKFAVSTAGANWVGVFKNTGTEATKHGVTIQVHNPTAKALEVRDGKRGIDLFVVRSDKTVYSTNMGIKRAGAAEWSLQMDADTNGAFVNNKTQSRWGFLNNYEPDDATKSTAFAAQHKGTVKFKVRNDGHVESQGRMVLNGATVSSTAFSTLYATGGNASYAAEFSQLTANKAGAIHLRARKAVGNVYITGNDEDNLRRFAIYGNGRAHFIGAMGIGADPSDVIKLQVASTNLTTARLDNTANSAGATGMRIKVKSTANNGSDKYFIHAHTSDTGTNPEFSVTANGLVKANAYSNNVDTSNITTATTTPILANSNIFRWTIKSGTTIANPDRSHVGGGSWFFYIIQDSTGGHNVSWGNQYHMLGGAINVSPGAVNICNVICDGTDNYDVIIMQR